MASNFPKLPGYVPTHDPFNDEFNPKKISHVHLEKIRNHKDQPVPLYAVPRPPAANFTETKADASKSVSHVQFPNHFGEDINKQFEPTYVMLDKQVSFSTIVEVSVTWLCPYQTYQIPSTIKFLASCLIYLLYRS
jgi:hypothetical protein